MQRYELPRYIIYQSIRVANQKVWLQGTTWWPKWWVMMDGRHSESQATKYIWAQHNWTDKLLFIIDPRDQIQIWIKEDHVPINLPELSDSQALTGAIETSFGQDLVWTTMSSAGKLTPLRPLCCCFFFDIRRFVQRLIDSLNQPL